MPSERPRIGLTTPIRIPSALLVIGGTLAFAGASIVAAIPTLDRVAGGPAASFAVVAPYLLTGLATLMCAVAAVLSWIHDDGLFRWAMLFVTTLTLATAAFFPATGITIGVFAFIGWLAFREAERTGARGLSFSIGRQPDPVWTPPEDYVPGGNLSKTRAGIIEEYRKSRRGQWEQDQDQDPHGE